MSWRSVPGDVLRAGPAAWRRGANGWHRHRVVKLVRPLLRHLGDTGASWVAGPVLVSSTRTAVVPLGPARSAPVAMAKLPGTTGGVSSQHREGRALAKLAAEPALGDFTRFLPLRLTDGRLGRQPFVLERAIPGVPADAAGFTAATVGAASTIALLHARTARPTTVDDHLLRRWVDERVEILSRTTRRRDAVERLNARLRAAWLGRDVEVGWVHGDFWLGNVVVDPTSGGVTGIVDWEWASADELPDQDLVYTCVHARMRSTGQELGDVVADLLARPSWDPAERELLRAAGAPAEPGVDPDVLLLVWLRQIAANLVQAPGLARNPLWVFRNVVGVLRTLDACERPNGVAPWPAPSRVPDHR